MFFACESLALLQWQVHIIEGDDCDSQTQEVESERADQMTQGGLARALAALESHHNGVALALVPRLKHLDEGKMQLFEQRLGRIGEPQLFAPITPALADFAAMQ
jgi:hypothetical protein